MDGETSFLSADFSSFEDFSSRMILLPRDDDECTGAKVGSHEVPPEIATDSTGRGISAEDARLPLKEKGRLMEDVNLDDPAKTNDTAVKEISTCSEQPNSNAKDVEQPDKEQNGKQNGIQVPFGYVLVGIRNLNESEFFDSDTNGMPEDLESIEFADLLSALREASFPLSLVFAPPNDTPTSHGSFFDENDNSECKAVSATDSSSEESSDDVSIKTEKIDPSQSLSIVSREDAAKYAKQAATDLRGRLSRWGYQAATRAADAASHVKELRDERQRKDEHQIRDVDIGDGDREYQLEAADHNTQSDLPVENTANEKAEPVDLPVHTSVPEKIDSRDIPVETTASQKNKTQDVPMNSRSTSLVADTLEKKYADPGEQCFFFLQTRTGFKQLPDGDPLALPRITNNSVVSVRLSNDKACPLGKNGGYTFQWYRSGMVKESSERTEEKSNHGSLSWSLLRGANYAAYQPSVFDAGHQLRCIVKRGTDGNISQQTCDLPCLVAMDPTLFNSVKMTLLGGKKSVTFGNLRSMDDLTNFRLKIVVSSSDDFISFSSVFIDKVGSSTDESLDEMEPASHFAVVADPAKPRLFDLICSSHGRLRLDAANRKSRESLLLALGIASFKGKLSSLTPESNLFPSYVNEAELPAESDPSSSKLHQSPHNSHAEMHRLLESKDIAITKLQQELVRVGKELDSYRDSERLSKDALERCEATRDEKIKTIEGLNKAQSDAKITHERTVKALMNEKAVLQAAVEARDGKIEGLTNQAAKLESRASQRSEHLSNIESLKSNLVQTQKKLSSAERVITKMKETESGLQKDRQGAKGMVRDLNEKFLLAKETATRRESDCKKLRMERNNLKNRADGLSKELKMLRISKSTAEALEIEKLKAEVQRLTQENSDLQEQVEMTQSEKRDALGKLEATVMAHQQSVVSYQQSLSPRGSPRKDRKGNIGTRVSEQRIDELENMISSMTEYQNAQEMQIETLKQVNRALTGDMNGLKQP